MNYIDQIVEWHNSRNIRFEELTSPYSVGENFEHYCDYIEDDGHRCIRMFILNSNTIEFIGYLCLCGIFVDLKHNPDSYFNVRRCGIDLHFGCEILLPQGIQSPYLLSSNYRDYVLPADKYYYCDDDLNLDYLNYLSGTLARKEINEFLSSL